MRPKHGANGFKSSQEVPDYKQHLSFLACNTTYLVLQLSYHFKCMSSMEHRFDIHGLCSASSNRCKAEVGVWKPALG